MYYIYLCLHLFIHPTVSGLAYAKVRAMFDHAGTVVSEAGLSDAVQIIGWRELPLAGDEILEVENEKKAHLVMKFRKSRYGEAKSVEQKIVADEKNKQHRVVSVLLFFIMEDNLVFYFPNYK